MVHSPFLQQKYFFRFHLQKARNLLMRFLHPLVYDRPGIAMRIGLSWKMDFRFRESVKRRFACWHVRSIIQRNHA